MIPFNVAHEHDPGQTPVGYVAPRLARKGKEKYPCGRRIRRPLHLQFPDANVVISEDMNWIWILNDVCPSIN